MTETLSAPSQVIVPAPSENEVEKIYAPRRGLAWKFCFLLFGASLFCQLPLILILSRPHGTRGPDAGIFFLFELIMTLPFFALSVFVLSAVRGLPRLTITTQEFTFKTILRAKRVNWHSVGAFTIKPLPRRFYEPWRIASARLVGPNVNTSSRRVRIFSIADTFETPIDTIVQDLNAARMSAVGAGETFPVAEVDERSVGLAKYRAPWLTFFISAALVAIFIMENEFSVTPGVGSTPSLMTLLAFGALSFKAVIGAGQWYRLFTAPLLHGSVAHIAGNGIALLLGGWLLERLVGRLWFFALFVIGALGGSLMSLAVSSPNMISVGASGAIMGLFAALLVSSFRLPSGTQARSWIQVQSTRILIPSLLPMLSKSSVHIDYGAHFGGALSGALATAVLLRFWPATERIPQLRKVAGAISGVGAFLFVVGACFVIVDLPEYRTAAAQLAPLQQAPAPSSPPVSSAHPDRPATAEESETLQDHGPKRAACDGRWTASAEQKAVGYPAFLHDCMKK